MLSKIRLVVTRGLTGFLIFNRGVLSMPLHLQVWVVLLVVANIVAPLFFLNSIEAWVTLSAGVLGIVLMSALTAHFGFSRIIGLGHVAWLPLVAFLGYRLLQGPTDDAFGTWLRIVFVLDIISLIFDSFDVFRYARGERAEIVPSQVASQE